MSYTPNAKGHFDPVHAAHAIEQAVFVLHFDRPLEQSKLNVVIGKVNEFKSDFPGSGLIQGGFSVAFGSPVMPMPSISQPMPLAGVVMHRSAPDGSIENELRVEHASVTFRTTRYTRWAAMWELAKKYCDAVIQTYLDNGSKISSISINFVDKFVWTGGIQDFDLSLLLSRDSKYIADYVFSAEDLWHIHTGAFLRPDSKTKRLMNINVDCLDEVNSGDIRRAVLITTVLTDIFNQAGFEEIAVANDDVMNFISTHVESLHAFDKEILGKILVESIAKRIALIG